METTVTRDERRIEIDVENENSAPESADHRLEDELGRVDVMSTTEGYVEGQVTALETVDETTVRLEVALPHGRTVTFTLEKPIPWSEEFLLARIVEDVGYDAASVGHLVGESVYVTRADLEDDTDPGWDGLWSSSAGAADRALTALLEASFGRRFETGNTEPVWRLVDPRERPDPDEGTNTGRLTAAIAVGLVLSGVILAAAGAVFGAMGSLVVSGSAVAYALPGLFLALAGLIAAYSLASPESN